MNVSGQNTINIAPYVNPPANTTGSIFNSITVWDATSQDQSPTHLITRPVSDVKETKQYFDGLGRLLQTVNKQYSPLGNDLVTPVYFDAYGKSSLAYLPFISNTTANSTDVTNDGNIKLDPFQQQTGFYNNLLTGQSGETNVGTGKLNWAYGQTNYEASPLNRVLSTYAPGVNWIGSAGTGSQHIVQDQYVTNTAADNVQNWSCSVASGAIPASIGAYNAGVLYKKIIIDESGNQTIEYTNFDGKMVLKQVQASASPGTNHSGWQNTYYIYDDIGNLRYVLQPAAIQLLLSNSTWSLTSVTNLLTNFAFYYEYDYRNRLIIKRVPGAQPVYMVYDARDRIVLTQDGNLRTSNQWIFTKYDALDRPVMTGTYTDNTNLTQATEQTYLNSLGMGFYETFAAGSFPQYTLTNSFPSTTASNILTVTYYDNYLWTTSTPLSAGYDATQASSGFQAASTTAYPYPVSVALTPYTTLGIVTGTISKLMTAPSEYTTQYDYSASYYDDHNRISQSQSINVSGGIDKTTNQFAFDGKLVVSKTAHNKSGTNAQSYTVITTNNYDNMGRVQSVTKNVNNGAIAADQQTIATNSYDELGRLRTKALGASLDNLTYDYNVRGWLLGINRAYLSTVTTPTNLIPSAGNWFGMELAYDQTSSQAVDNSYAAAQFNGNIAGTVWKTAADGIGKKYDFTYDKLSRLTAANYKQDNGSGSYDVSAGLNFSVSNLAYDPNGNIMSMNEMGWQIGKGSTTIDQLTYTYLPNSNQLQNVINPYSNAATTLGDFRYSQTYTTALGGAGVAKPTSAVDYAYDNKGNLKSDKNKDITSISYNYMNLPQLITIVNSKGTSTIQYVYDASGNKLQKIAIEPNGTVNNNGTNVTSTITTVTSYIGLFNYKSVTYATGSLSSLQYTDNLQFIGQEEGRVRALYKNAATPNTLTGYAFDYFEKDHLGNTRIILTDEAEIDYYPPATLEGSTSSNTSAISYEQNFYNINSSYVVASSTLTSPPSSYPNNNNTLNYTTSSNLYPAGNAGNTNASAPSTNLYRINGNANKMGLGITLKVMAGDKLSFGGQSYYFVNNAGDNSSYNLPILTLLTGFLGAPGASSLPAAADAGVTATQLDAISTLTGNVGTYLTTNAGSLTRTPTTSTNARAYLNWIFFDNQFNYAGGGFLSVGSSGAIRSFSGNSTVATKSGYVYVYCSNESPIDVYFDNIQVVQTRGPLIEENHYYPFGLTMAGISDKAVKSNYAENKFRFNHGKELQNKEFSDGSGLELYDVIHRMYDPQLGRFNQIDPLSDVSNFISPYSFAQDNPLSHFDPLGLTDSVITTKTTNLAPVTVWGHKKQASNWLGWPESTKSERQIWQRNQGIYADRLNKGQPRSQNGDPASYTASLAMYERWTQEEKNYRAMQSWAVGIIAAPALIATSPAQIGIGVLSQKLSAFAIDASIQTTLNLMEHKDPVADYNAMGGLTSFLIGAPEGASLTDLAQVSLLNSTISTSVNLSIASVVRGDKPIFSFNPLSIMINASFGTAAGSFSQFLDVGTPGDAYASPLNFVGGFFGDATNPKEK